MFFLIIRIRVSLFACMCVRAHPLLHRLFASACVCVSVYYIIRKISETSKVRATTATTTTHRHRVGNGWPDPNPRLQQCIHLTSAGSYTYTYTSDWWCVRCIVYGGAIVHRSVNINITLRCEMTICQRKSIHRSNALICFEMTFSHARTT